MLAQRCLSSLFGVQSLWALNVLGYVLLWADNYGRPSYKGYKTIDGKDRIQIHVSDENLVPNVALTRSLPIVVFGAIAPRVVHARTSDLLLIRSGHDRAVEHRAESWCILLTLLAATPARMPHQGQTGEYSR